MTALQYLIWFIATAVMTIALLAVGIMAAADILPRRRHGASDEETPGNTHPAALPGESPSADAADSDRPWAPQTSPAAPAGARPGEMADGRLGAPGRPSHDRGGRVSA
ncbi:hypothetical protein GCM10022237_43840 [Nocardioides ginsengisoli]